MRRRVVVCSMGAVTSLGNFGPGVNDFWEALLAGKTGFRRLHPIDPEDPENNFGIQAKVVGDIADFDPANYKDIRDWSQTPKYTGLDKAVQIGLLASHYAVSGVDLDLRRLGFLDERIAVVCGTGLGGGRSSEGSLKSFLERGANRQMTHAVVNTMPNALAGRVSICFGFRGPSYAISAACASSADALISGCDMIRLGRVDAALIAGSEALTTPHYLATFDRLNALSTNESLTASMPFGLARDGFVMAEGAGAMFIAEHDFAVKRGWPILAEIAGYAANGGATDIVSPNPKWAGRCMQLALEDAGYEPSHIDAINTHGTSTPEGDISESNAIYDVFGSDPVWSPIIWSTKANIGHTLGGAGIIESIVAVQTLTTGQVHQMGKYELDPSCLYPNGAQTSGQTPLRIVAEGATIKDPRAVMSNSFGFGDTNATLIFSKV